MAIQDRPLLIINGKTLPYNNKVSYTDGSPEVETKGQVGGPPIKRLNYDNAFATVKVNIRYSAETEVIINEIKANSDNNSITYGTVKITGCVLKTSMIERSYGEDVDLEFNGNPVY